MSFKNLGTDYGYIYYENNSKSAVLEETVKFTEFDGLELQFPFSGDSISVSLDPGENIIAIVKKVKDAYKLNCQIFTQVKDNSIDIVKEVKTKGQKSNP